MTPCLHQIEIDECDLLCLDRNRRGGGVACYIRNNLSYNVKSYIPKDISKQMQNRKGKATI